MKILRKHACLNNENGFPPLCHLILCFSKKPEHRITWVKSGVILLFIGIREPLDDALQTYWVIHPFNLIVGCIFVSATLSICPKCRYKQALLFFSRLCPLAYFLILLILAFLHFGTKWLNQNKSSRAPHHSLRTHNLNFHNQ